MQVRTVLTMLWCGGLRAGYSVLRVLVTATGGVWRCRSTIDSIMTCTVDLAQAAVSVKCTLRGILVPKLTPLAKRGLWHAGMRRARLQAGRGAGSLAMQARPAGAHGHQMLRREAERRVRGPVLQGVAARATTPGRDGGDRGAERLHRAAARRMLTSHRRPTSWRRTPLNLEVDLEVEKMQGSSLTSTYARRSPDRRWHLSVRRHLRSSPRLLAGRAHPHADRRRRAPPQRAVRPDTCAKRAVATPSMREVRRCAHPFKF